MTKSFHQTTLSCAVATAVHLALFPGTALAQGTDSAESLVLEEIIVTAQRREQNIQDTPLSVSAISGDRLGAAGVIDNSSLKLLVPGMNFGQQGSYAYIAMRGARTEGVQVNTQPIISNYMDGIYRAGTENFIGPMLDVNRVEVLRGPQGTTFGRNSYAGVIAVYSNKPSAEGFDASIKYTGGDFSRSDLEGMVNVPLSDTISARIVAAHFEHDGYVKNSASGDDFNDRDADYIRGSLLFEFDKGSLIMRAERFEQGGHGSGDFQGVLSGSLLGGDVFEVAQPFNTGSGCGSYSNVDQSLVIPNPGAVAPFTYANSLCPVPDADNPYATNFDAPYILEALQETYSAELNWDFESTSMKLLAATTDSSDFRTGDGDVGPAPAYLSGEIVMRDTNQFEIHFTDNGESNVSWIAGAVYYTEESRDHFFFNADPIGTGFPFVAITDRQIDHKSFAFFGQATFPLSDSTRLTVGARASDEENDWVVNDVSAYSFSQPIPRDFRDINLETGEFSFTEGSGPYASPTPDQNFSGDFDPVVWRVAVDHDLADDSLIYASVATGYSSGGMNSIQDPHTGLFVFDEQETIAYELGYKATLKDGAMTLNMAAYYNDFKDYIAEPAGVIGGGGAVIVFDRVGGDAEAMGIDLEMDWIPAEDWYVSLRASFLNAEYGNFVTGLGGNLATAGGLEETYTSLGTPLSPVGTQEPEMRLDGRQIAFSPDFTLGLTVSKTIELGGSGSLTPLAQFYYSDSYSASDQGYLHGLQDAYSQTSLRLTWVSEDERFNISGFVDNLEDEAVIARANIFGATVATRQFAAPRTYGISVSYNHR
jgi:iron complex outermembrane recepter protein